MGGMIIKTKTIAIHASLSSDFIVIPPFRLIHLFELFAPNGGSLNIATVQCLHVVEPNLHTEHALPVTRPAKYIYIGLLRRCRPEVLWPKRAVGIGLIP